MKRGAEIIERLQAQIIEGEAEVTKIVTAIGFVALSEPVIFEFKGLEVEVARSQKNTALSQ